MLMREADSTAAEHDTAAVLVCEFAAWLLALTTSSLHAGAAYQRRATIPAIALKYKLPLCMWSKETFEHGALMSWTWSQL